MDLREARVGLALSGGGFRAALFHLGVIRLLHESGCLAAVKHVSAVSGGSILAAHLILNWEKYNSDKFDEAAAQLMNFIRTDVRGKIVRRWILGCATLIPRFLLPKSARWTFVKLLQKYYAQLFAGSTIKGLRRPGRPRITINCASLTTGDPCYFDESGFTWYDDGKAVPINTLLLPVSFAVAASSAFPPLFPPVEISSDILSCDKVKFPNTQRLADGGIYDNLGVESLMRQQVGHEDLDLVIISNAEGNFDSDFHAHYSFVIGRNIRASDLLMRRVSTLQVGGVTSGFISSISIEIGGEVKNLDDPSLLDPGAQRSLINIRTDLDQFSAEEVTALIAHGFSKARDVLIRGVRTKEGKEVTLRQDAPRFSWDPLKTWAALQSREATERLKDSSVRKLRLWSFRDWASWATVAFGVCIATVVLGGPAILVALQTAPEVKGAQRAQVNAEAMTQQVALALDTLLSTNKELSTARYREQAPGWELARLGDCTGQDFTATPGKLPLDSVCTDADKTAVCWDGVQFTNKSQFNGAPWCTYKSVPADRCVGGSASGRLYRCIPKQNKDTAINVKSYQVCIGGNPSGCPSDAVYLSCQDSIADWAKDKCASFVQNRTSASPGGMCGYSIVQVTCVAADASR